MNLWLVLLLAVAAGPYVLQVALPAASSGGNLIGHPTYGHLALLYLPPLLTAAVALVAAAWPGRQGTVATPGPGTAG
jgi:hypothetical protein